jgi:hypothetical protein
MNPDPDSAFKVNPVPVSDPHPVSDPVPDLDSDSGFWWPKLRKKIKLKKINFFWSKIAIYLSLGFHKDLHATGEACGPQKRTSSTSKNDILYLFKAFLAFLRFISSHCYFPSILSLQGGCLISSHKGQDETNKKKIRHVWWQNKDKIFL